MSLLNHPVLVSAVATIALFRTRWTFSQNFSTSGTSPDPVFELTRDNITWYGPVLFWGKGADFITFTYPVMAFPPIAWRVLSTPTVVTWAGYEFPLPQTGAYPYP